MGVYKGQRPNIFRAVSGSLFSSPINWSRGTVPTGSDIAVIADNCIIDVSRTIGGLVVQPQFTASVNTGLTFQINDIIDVKGHLSCSGAPNIISAAKKNSINSFSADSSTFTYSGSNQNVSGLTYNNLIIKNSGVKTLIGHTIISGSLVLSGDISSILKGNLECGNYNLSINGITYFQCGGLYKSGNGSLLFVGNFQSVNGYNTNRISFTGNPSIEFRGGINRGNYDWNGGWNTGTGDWVFTTNNQTFQGPDGYFANSTCRFIVSGSITITYTAGSQHFFANKIDGTTASSTWINQGTMYFTGTEITPMETGVFDYLTSANSVIGYRTSNNFNLPYSEYQSLSLGGTRIASLSNNTIINKDLTLNPLRTLECSIYNLSVLGNAYVGSTISKTNSGSILFVGNVIFGTDNGVGNLGTFDFSGNPNIEFRGGITAGAYGTYNSFNGGTGVWKFSTNNQTFQFGSVLPVVNYNFTILIDGAITLSVVNMSNTVLTNFNNSINGNNANSKLLLLSTTVMNYNSATQPMITGSLDTSTNLNTFIYGSGSQDIKGNTYRNLTLNGSGTKTLQGNVSVQNTYTLTAPATLNNNSFTLTNP
jgi:hypothetical protein